MAKYFLPLMTATALIVPGGCKNGDKDVSTPPYAASTQTWVFGDQTWSDAIQIPACNKASFTESYTKPHCRSYTTEGKTYYYYNWPYVNVNAATLCPSPWRIPTIHDFKALMNNASPNVLNSAWCHGGLALHDQIHFTHLSRFWSSTELFESSPWSWCMEMVPGGYPKSYLKPSHNGLQIRCVK
jgi:hypothetical protein